MNPVNISVVSSQAVEIKPEDIESDPENFSEQTKGVQGSAKMTNLSLQDSHETNCDVMTANRFNYVCNTARENVDLRSVSENANEKVQPENVTLVRQQSLVNNTKTPTVVRPLSELTGEINNRKVQNQVHLLNGNEKNGEPLNKHFSDKIIHDEEIVMVLKGNKCLYCSYESSSRQHIKHHIRWNHRDQEIFKKPPKKLVKCPHCPELTTDLTRHILTWHTNPEDVNWFICGHCDFKTKFKPTLKQHIESKHIDVSESDLIKCKDCTKKYKSRSTLYKHIINIHRPEMKKTLICDVCEYSTHRKDSLTTHMSRHFKIGDGYKCTKCEFSGNNLKELNAHRKEHDEWRQCHLCSFKTKSNGVLRLHLIFHQEKKRDEDMTYRCKKCDYKTYRMFNLQSHMLSHKKPEELEMFHCYHCDFKAKRKDNLKTHIFKHDIFKNHLDCYICGTKVRSKYELKKHMDIHSEEQKKERELKKNSLKNYLKKKSTKDDTKKVIMENHKTLKQGETLAEENQKIDERVDENLLHIVSNGKNIDEVQTLVRSTTTVNNRENKIGQGARRKQRNSERLTENNSKINKGQHLGKKIIDNSDGQNKEQENENVGDSRKRKNSDDDFEITYEKMDKTPKKINKCQKTLDSFFKK